VRSIGQVPLPYARSVTHKPDDRDTRYWNEAGSPLYPFGFGLSYSSFAYTNLKIAKSIVAPGEDARVDVDLTNTGNHTADEVAQLYIHQRYGTTARPVRELKGFARVTLEPGETRTITFSLRAEDLRYWSAATRDWVQDETIIDVFAGGDSTASLSASFEVKRA
jgi:beta-glucosidase